MCFGALRAAACERYLAIALFGLISEPISKQKRGVHTSTSFKVHATAIPGYSQRNGVIYEKIPNQGCAPQVVLEWERPLD